MDARRCLAERNQKWKNNRSFHRQPDSELRAAAGFTLNFNAAAVALDDTPGCGQTQTRPARAGGIEGFEDFIQIIRSHANARVNYIEPNSVLFRSRLKRQLAALFHGLLSIQHEVEQRLLEQL